MLFAIETNCGGMRLPLERDWKLDLGGKTQKKKSFFTFLNLAECQVEKFYSEWKVVLIIIKYF